MKIPVGLCFQLATSAQNTGIARAEWLYKAKWGVALHFFSPPGTQIAEWNARVNRVDVQRIAEQVAGVGANYLVYTVGQNSGLFCAPNASYEAIVGATRCSERDLISDLSKGLSRHNLKLIVYMPSGGPAYDAIAARRLGWKENGEADQAFQANWEKVIRDFSDRWKALCSGWWFDGVYRPNTDYRTGTHNFSTFAAAAKSGNAASILAFNGGQDPLVRPLCEYDDYTAGEVNEASAVVCHGRLVDGAQFHMMSYLGSNWGQPNKRYTDEQAQDISKKVIGKGGTVTWDCPIEYFSEVKADFLGQLAQIGDSVAKLR